MSEAVKLLESTVADKPAVKTMKVWGWPAMLLCDECGYHMQEIDSWERSHAIPAPRVATIMCAFQPCSRNGIKLALEAWQLECRVIA